MNSEAQSKVAEAFKVATIEPGDQIRAAGTEAGIRRIEASRPKPEPMGADPDLVPELPEKCWRRGFREFREAHTETTEAADAFLWSGYLVVSGLVLGREAALDCGVEVYPNIYLTNVGPTAHARKTTGQAKARRLLQHVDEGVEVSAGVGSPEGLLQLLAENKTQPRPVLLDLNETATMLRKGAQDGSKGLLPFLTAAYDCPPTLRLPNRKEDLEAAEPFLSIIGSSTAEWLRNSLNVDDVRGGLAGRFVYVTGTDKPPIAWPPLPNLTALAEAERILIEVRDRHSSPKRYGMSPEAREVWEPWYVAERQRTYPGDLLGALAGRLHLHAWKLSLIHAAIEGTDEITAEQIGSGIAFADYQREVQRYALSDLGASKARRNEDKIKRAVSRFHKEGVNPKKWQVQRRIGGDMSAEDLNRSDRALTESGQMRVDEDERLILVGSVG